MGKLITIALDSSPIQHLCCKDKRIAKVISIIGAISYETYTDNQFSFLVHEIIEQMLSKKAGILIYNRLSALCGGTISSRTIDQISVEEIRSIGTSNSKANYIKALSKAVISGKLNFDSFTQMSDEEILKELTAVKGIGTWTAKMYLIFVLDRQDILPYEDIAFLQGYKWLYKTENVTPESVKKKCKKWRPYSSIAARYLYRAVDMGLTKSEFHLYQK